ncbi:NADPH-dependent FMN reductase [Chelativorans salis]|uniref:NAD(P)H-dependent oxidoreductase n=1 Tax=Chelativorans salis TaxID=2978478 RepID=A0ABT2LMG2_9HYPH|nr:NAD(P)H-dependent oxidoreductase [Chelativorans sp. EGI FJ00035]MCT7374863.1 NAD(P)H-dependent oxidoreductase [Chelativorans sp. EGI FJ00035]
MAKLKTGIIIGSTREGRFAAKAADWIYGLAKVREELDVELVDLADYPLPFFTDAVPPAYGPSENAHVQAWQKKIAGLDGYILTAAEYNRGPTGVLKNALDYAYREWNNKPVAFVGYGGVGGARAVEQLRLHAVELQMAPIRTAVHVLLPDFMAVRSGEKSLSGIEHLNQGGGDMLDQFVWWAKALKAARDEDAAVSQAA